MKSVIFLGPSLPLDEARQILDAVYLPPAKQCDLLTATVNEQPDVIGFIDGEFLQSLSVWHKEILYALDQGIMVYGASSMGALRAAETSEFGMVGVGEIYRQYISGELIDDDEVALAHASAELRYQKLSEPMVNVRATFQAAHAAGIIDSGQLAQLLSIAKSIYFAHRTYRVIFEAAIAQGLPRPQLNALDAFIETNYVDLKRQDAIELLHTIKQLPASKSNGRKGNNTFKFNRSTAFETLYNRDRQVQHSSVKLHLESISNYVALHNPEFDELNFNGLNRAVVYSLAEILGLEVSDDALEAECARFCKRKGLTDDAALSAWLAANHLNVEEFRDLMSQIVLCRRLHSWFLIAIWMERSSKVILDELRLKGQYPDWVARAAAQERLVASEVSQEPMNTSQISVTELLAEHRSWTECSIDIDPAKWAEEAGFHTIGNLKMELSQARRARLAMLKLMIDSSDEEGDGQELLEQGTDVSRGQKFDP